jgi:hypothetical protein
MATGDSHAQATVGMFLPQPRRRRPLALWMQALPTATHQLAVGRFVNVVESSIIIKSCRSLS